MTRSAAVLALLVRPMMGAIGIGMNMSMGGKAGPYAMAHMGAQLRVSFPTAGVYQFKLVDRGDYFKNTKTIGPTTSPPSTSPSAERSTRRAGRGNGPPSIPDPRRSNRDMNDDDKLEPIVIVCSECGAEIPAHEAHARGWSNWPTGVEIYPYCPDCAEREFEHRP